MPVLVADVVGLAEHLGKDEQHEQRGQRHLEQQDPELLAGYQDVPPENRVERAPGAGRSGAAPDGRIECRHRRALPVRSMKTSSRLARPMWTSETLAARSVSTATTGPSRLAGSADR